jgi:hypothetical protein
MPRFLREDAALAAGASACDFDVLVAVIACAKRRINL